MKQPDVIEADFEQYERVIVFSENNMYDGKYGNVERLGSAGEQVYYHVRLDGINTPITFIRKQIQKA